MLEKFSSLSCSVGVSGLSRLFGCIRLTRWTGETGYPNRQGVFQTYRMGVLLRHSGFL